MSKLNDIQNGILQLEGGRYQKLLDCYLFRKYGYDNWSPLGSQLGTDKPTKGTPDTFVRTPDGKYIFLMYGTVQNNSFSKIREDIKSCLDKSKTGINVSDIAEIICCHTSARLDAGENKELYELFPNLKLIGIGELSQELFYKYQGLAKEYLGVSIDTNQILDDADFVSKSEASAFTTPLSNQLLCRDNEKSELQILLDKSDVLIISGKSGNGKTRLALDAAREFCSKNNYIFKCIKQNGESIYEDLKSYFIDESDYLVLVDDANMLAQLNHVIDVCSDKNRNHKMKLLITVRDYAIKEVSWQMKDKVLPEQYQLTSLTDENIKEILEQGFAIKNTEYLGRIVKLSSGNMRLAIMATTSLKAGRLTRLDNIIDIYDFYYQEITEKMDKELIIVGALLAFFDSMRLNDPTHLIYQVAANSNISADKIQDICYTLHKLEVVDIYNQLAVKFSEQGLGNYLLYLVFYKTRWINISDVINICFLWYRKRIVYAFDTLLQLFYSEELHKYAFSEIRRSWDIYSNKNNTQKKEFLSAFHIALKNETLRFLKQEIDQLPEKHENFLLYDFNSKNNYEKIDSDIIEMIARFKRADEFGVAIQLLFSYIDKNTVNPMDFYVLLKSHLLIDKDSYRNEYRTERQLIKQFWEQYLNSKNSNIAVLVIYMCKWLLKFEFHSFDKTSDKSITSYVMGLIDCDGVRKLRDECIGILFILYNDETKKYKKNVLNVVKSYAVLDNFESSLSIAEMDLKKFNDCIESNLAMEDINDCLITEYLYHEMKRDNLLNDTYLRQFEKNSQFEKYKKMRKDRSRWIGNDKAAVEYAKQIALIANSATLDEFEQIIALMKQDEFSDDWEFRDGLTQLFNGIADKGLFFAALNSYFIQDTPFGINPYDITKKMIHLEDYHDVWGFIEAHDFKQKSKWLVSLVAQVDENMINCEFGDKVLALVIDLKEVNSFVPPRLELVCRINEKCNGFASRYLRVILDTFSERPLVISDFIRGRGDLAYDDILSLFNYPEDLLMEEAYLYAITGRDYFDHNHELLLLMLIKNKRFLRKFLMSKMEHNDHQNTLICLWSLENHDSMVNEAMEIIRESDTYSFCQWRMIEDIFTDKGGDSKLIVKQDSWLEKYIDENYQSEELMNDIFHGICNYPEERRLKFMLQFFKKNPGEEIIQAVGLLSLTHPGSGSEVLQIEESINNANKIKEHLTGIDFLDIRIYLENYIESKQEEKEFALVKEFMDNNN